MHVFAIDPGAELPAEASRELAGNKGFNLLRMAALGLPVPPGFVLSAEFSRHAGGDSSHLSRRAQEALDLAVADCERRTGRRFGGDRDPLLLSVRSGAAASMPGMMETLLNVGLTEKTLAGLIAATGNPRLAWDCYRRLIRQYAETAHAAPAGPFDDAVAAALAEADATDIAGLDTLALRALARRFAAIFAEITGSGFPQDPAAQLAGAVAAVLRSWNGPRAVAYRRLHKLEHLRGTAVTVQQMVFGNAGGTSGAGVGFTRDPAAGTPGLYLDFVSNGQGEDVVAGRGAAGADEPLERVLPHCHAQLLSIADLLEQAFGDAQDFEFTIENERLHLLQTRAAKRTPWAALRIAIDMAREGRITPAEARHRIAAIDPAHLRRLHVEAGGAKPVARAVAASQGVAVGRIALSGAAAARMAADGPVILVRSDITTDDVEGMAVATGILTAKGNRTSHGAVVARQMDKVCLVGCGALTIDAGGGRLGDWRFAEGGAITLDANEGAIYAGSLPTRTETAEALLTELASLEGRAA